MNKKILSMLIIILTLVAGSMLSTKVHASFADFDDNQAAQETKKLEEQQKQEEEKKKEQEQKTGRQLSANNYLSDLLVEGYKITPEFNKEITEYSLQEIVESDKIKINAKAEDSNAKIEGSGQIKLEEYENNLRIDVTAENGTVRTYFITVKKNSEAKNIDNTANTTSITNTTNENVLRTSKDNKDNTSMIIILGIISFIIIIVIVIVLIKKSKRKKGRHA